MARGRPLATTRKDADDRRLIEAAQRDPRQFAAIYEENFDRIYAYIVTRVHARESAEDLAAEVFHHALEHLSTFEWRGVPFIAWLYRIASNAIADHLKHAAREQTVEIPDSGEQPDFEKIDRCAKLSGLIKDLPDDQRRVVELRFIDEQSIRDVARAIGRSEGAVKQLQFRALQNLRDRLGDHDA